MRPDRLFTHPFVIISNSIYTYNRTGIITKFGGFMKTLRKYAAMAFLLVSAATIVPAYANLEDKYVILKERIIQQSKRPEMLKKVFQGLEIAAVVGYCAIVSTGFYLWAKTASAALRDERLKATKALLL